MKHRPAARHGKFWLSLGLRAVLLMAGASMAGPASAAEPPSVTTMVRKSAAPGETLKVTLGGKGLAGDVRLWTSFGPPMPLADTPPDNGKTDGYCTFAVNVPAGTPLGMHALRVISPNGVSTTLPFLIDDLPTVEKKGGNQSLATAQELTIPGGVDGRVDNLSRDYYRFRVAAGQTVSFEVFCRRLGSPMDASLYLYDAKGRILAYSDDAEGLSTDPQFVYTFAKEGDYIVELRDIRYAGGDAFGYHLRIGDFPCVHTALPLAVKRGSTTRVDFAGVSCSDATPAMAAVPADWAEDWFPVSTRRSTGSSSAFATLAVVAADDVLDREPNNHQPQAQQIELGPSISGRFDDRGDIDQFTFSATKGQRYQFAGFTREIGAPSDLTFRVLNSEGKAIASADDNGTSEGTLDVTFPADGTYTLELVDLNKRGGPQYSYRVVPSLYRPGFSLSASTDTVNVPAGGTASLVVTAARRDYPGPIEIEVRGLPQGFRAGAARLGPGINSATVTISATPDAASMSLADVTIIGSARVQETAFEATASLVDALRGRWSGVTQVNPRFAESVVLTVAPARGITLNVDPAEVVFGPSLKATVKVTATRAAGFDGPIKLVTSPEKDGLPANITAELKPIEAGATEAVVTLTANEKAAKGPFSIALSGVHEKDKVVTTAAVPNLGLRLQEAFQLAAVPMATPMLARGSTLKLKVNVTRNPAYAGEVRLVCEKLPAGVTAPEIVLKADQVEAELTLSAAADATVGMASEVILRASSPAEAKISSTIPLPAFSVQ
ncbi:hypothetical protein Pan44_34710 [Caulifigura coniformis]|uniref:Peptidase C-terminal archaeal/bacterial domain-containing protein n=1 Tax=Caulifigura coniformis TaxID=2527983 RepID=A0A517SH24_9PLAN|nr:PPC domain-containing protein [Caulifigura coniformis]QDT55428.1 hypothetical protein Pan44_34710 [Caulifigura coniformis]